MRPSMRAALVSMVLMCAGCAGVPTGGRVVPGQRVEGAAPPDEPYVRIIPVSPLGKNWSPDQMIQGFLTASGSFDDNHAVARQYLAPNVSWMPDQSPSVIVTDERPTAQVVGRAPDGSIAVEVKGNQIGVIVSDGQYQAMPRQLSETFHLTQNAKKEWRISALPPDLTAGLLLSSQDIERVFRTRNLYFFAPDGKALVPNSVFLPLVNRGDLPSQIVRAQLKGPTAWLTGAVVTQFPNGTRLLGKVDVTAEGVATVNLSKDAAKGNRAGMSAQLMWALGQLPEVKHLRLEVNGLPVRPSATVNVIQSPLDWKGSGPDAAGYTGSQSAYISDQSGHLSVFTPGKNAVKVAGLGNQRLVKPGISLDGRMVAALSPRGDAVLEGELYSAPPMKTILRARPGATFTRPSWDRNGTLWVVESTANQSWLWTMVPGGQPVQDVWDLTGAKVLALRVALDGVRTAAIVSVNGKGQIEMGRIAKDKSGRLTTGTFLPISTRIADAIDLSWMNADHLAVLGRTESAAQPQPYDVPVSGGPIYSIGTGTPGGMLSITAAPKLPVLVGVQSPGQGSGQGTPQSQLCWLRDSADQLYSEWDCLLPGADPAYPG